jgi:hypothetical protein
MRTETPLWEKVYLGRWSKTYINPGKVIGHLGCRAMAFFDEEKKLPGYDKHRYECAVRDLTVWSKREQGEYELTATAKKVLRVIIGPAPDVPDYASWWMGRLISVEQTKREGQPVEWAEAPPVPLPGDGPKAEAEPAKKRARKKTAKK